MSDIPQRNNLSNKRLIAENDILNKRVIQWGRKYLSSNEYTLKCSLPKVVQNTPWSYVACFETFRGYIYLKHTPDLLALEAPVTKILHDKFHASVPKVIAHNVELSCFLMEDAGKSLRTVLKQQFDVTLFSKAIVAFTSIQLAVIDHVDIFLEMGVPDWRINKLPDLYIQMLSQKDILLMDGLSGKEISELKNLLPVVSSLCAKLASYAIKPSIVQSDFHDNNILILEPSEKITFIDLGEIVISHPFFSLIGCLQQAKRHHALTEEEDKYRQLMKAGFKNFIEFESEKSLLEAFDITGILHFVYEALCRYRLILACGQAKLREFQLGKLSALLKGFRTACFAIKDSTVDCGAAVSDTSKTLLEFNAMNYSLFISCPKGIETLLEEELTSFGVVPHKITVGGVFVQTSIELIYHICLWSRLANRVLLELCCSEVKSADDCYRVAYEINWPKIFSLEKTLSVSFRGQLPNIKNSMFGAQLIKDAIVDKFRDHFQKRPNINTSDAQCKIDARLLHGKLNLYYDLSGHSLHQRGYRSEAGAAPLKENLAAALLYRAKWPILAEQGYNFLDVFCGSGTLLIEAAMMALKKAPGLETPEFGFMHWQDFQKELWLVKKNEALEIFKKSFQTSKLEVYGFDKDTKVLQIAEKNIHIAKLTEIIKIEQRDLKDFYLPQALQIKKGLLVTNPPYGERLNEVSNLVPVYQQLGKILNEYCQGWQAAILTSEKLLAKAIGLRSQKNYVFFNGTLPCRLYLIDVNKENKLSDTGNGIPCASHSIYNRLKKNQKNLQAWIKKNDIYAYRVYDADIPEYAFAIDIYNDWVHIQEYQAPKIIPFEKTQKRILEVMQIVPLALNVPSEHILLKQRQIQKGKAQYQRQAQTGQKLIVKEGMARFIVNCRDYLDTGLFLDHRLLRLKFFEIAKGKNFLNLFCYTATASVHAALGGAKKTVSVDMSKTYLEWGRKNFLENKIDLKKNQLVQADCLEWVKNCNEKFNIIFLDPPSFSNSKRMNKTFDVQRDHEDLINATMNLLEETGELYFSTNLRTFKLSPKIIDKYYVNDQTQFTLDKDFVRNPNIHKCFQIKLKPVLKSKNYK